MPRELIRRNNRLCQLQSDGFLLAFRATAYMSLVADFCIIGSIPFGGFCALLMGLYRWFSGETVLTSDLAKAHDVWLGTIKHNGHEKGPVDKLLTFTFLITTVPAFLFGLLLKTMSFINTQILDKYTKSRAPSLLLLGAPIMFKRFFKREILFDQPLKVKDTTYSLSFLADISLRPYMSLFFKPYKSFTTAFTAIRSVPIPTELKLLILSFLKDEDIKKPFYIPAFRNDLTQEQHQNIDKMIVRKYPALCDEYSVSPEKSVTKFNSKQVRQNPTNPLNTLQKYYLIFDSHVAKLENVQRDTNASNSPMPARIFLSPR